MLGARYDSRNQTFRPPHAKPGATSGASTSAEDLLSPFGQLAGAGLRAVGALTFRDLQSRCDNHMRWGRRSYAKVGFMRDVSDDAIAALIDLIADAPTPDRELYFLQLGSMEVRAPGALVARIDLSAVIGTSDGAGRR